MGFFPSPSGAWVPVAHAQSAAPAPPSAADREAAQRAFAQAQHAFKTGDFRHAAEQFEVAYSHAPHPDVIWNAARAWHRARELPRAATLYAKYLREAPADARDRNSATAALRDLSSKVARLDIVAPDFQDVRVDEQPLDGGSVYVTPGAHVVEGKIDGRSVRQTPSVAAGDVVSVALVAPPPPPPVVAPPPPPATTTIEVADGHGKRGRTWSPVVVYVGGALTLVATGVSIWSALDTEQARRQYNGTQQALDDGLSKEHRTNIAVAVSGGLGAVTLLSTLLFVDWHKHSPSAEPGPSPGGAPGGGVSFGIGPGSLVARGSF